MIFNICDSISEMSLHFKRYRFVNGRTAKNVLQSRISKADYELSNINLTLIYID